MHLSLAFLSFFVAVFLPGSIVYGCIQKFILHKSIKDNVALFIVASFILSLCVNFYLIYALIALGIYTKAVVLGIVIIESVLFLWLFGREIITPLNIPKVFSQGPLTAQILYIIGVIIALCTFNKLLEGGIFTDWDAVVSWDRWATAWANGHFVLNDWAYPQLYPMLLSLGYVLSEQPSSFQGIGRAIYWYFLCGGMLASAFLFNASTLGYQARYAMFGIVASVLTYVVLFGMVKQFYVGYVDMPVAMIIFISALCLLRASLLESQSLDSINTESTNKRVTEHFTQSDFYIILGALSAGISAEVKQSGLFWCVCFLLGVWILTKKRGLKIFWLSLALVLIFTLPWVIIALYKKLILHTDATNMSYVMNDIFLGKGYFERLTDAIKHNKNLFLLFLASLLSLRLPHKILGLMGVCGFVYFIFWGMCLSYDLRNLQGGLPLMIIALSGVVVYCYPLLKNLIVYVRKYLPMLFMGGIVVGLVAGYFAQDRILKSEEKRKICLSGCAVTNLLLKSFDEYGREAIITSNQLLVYVPKFERKEIKYFAFGKHIKEGEFEAYATKMKEELGKFYILVPDEQYTRYAEFLKNAIMLGTEGGYTLVYMKP
ncbi:hypothetical protein LS71_008565 [Helicobacter jaachi]|uniref:Glycosyltransferase RgtA/B/C/D-like domain-containing protein n=1 Tax=Helicobacter jaachi TaxID=1677920 RepID=A0A4U8T6N3_9HELI|nr:hypothetical protein [Helicobacter jaachi]TLD95138.1 hypothetical protein LS71_008565 [Helicobacter jaachi]